MDQSKTKRPILAFEGSTPGAMPHSGPSAVFIFFGTTNSVGQSLFLVDSVKRTERKTDSFGFRHLLRQYVLHIV